MKLSQYREMALGSAIIDEIWSVADFVVATDPALSSYLAGDEVSAEGRDERDSDSTAHHC
jgi:hypothetical protein